MSTVVSDDKKRDFYRERLAQRLIELRRRHEDDATFRIKATELLTTFARGKKERKKWKSFLKMFKAAVS